MWWGKFQRYIPGESSWENEVKFPELSQQEMHSENCPGNQKTTIAISNANWYLGTLPPCHIITILNTEQMSKYTIRKRICLILPSSAQHECSIKTIDWLSVVSRWCNGLARLQQELSYQGPGFESHLCPVEFFTCNKVSPLNICAMCTNKLAHVKAPKLKKSDNFDQ